jgi:outer membrane protein assembly factor BamB
MIEFDTAFQPKLIWQNPKIGVHWMTPVNHEGHLYAVDGERENNIRLICVNADTGSELWSQTLTWEDLTLTRNLGRSNPVRLGFLRGSLLRTPQGFIGLGELGTLLSLQLSPQTATIRAQAPLFYATNTWSLPAISRGLLYVCQQGQDMDISQNAGPRILCFDLRPTKP